MASHDDHSAGPAIHSQDQNMMEGSSDENAMQPSSTPAVRLLAQHAMRGSNTASQHPHLAPADLSTRREHPIRAQHSPSSGTPRPFYTSTQWTADGTSLIATTSTQAISSFVLPADLLQPAETSRALQPHATLRLPEPTQVVAAAPYFSLADPSSQLLLVGCRDHPLQLYHAFPSNNNDNNNADESTSSGPDDSSHSAPLSSYKLIRKESEQYITPASLLWEHPGTHFVCGSPNRLDYFDISRPGSDGPILTIPTIPSRRHISKGHGVGMKGTVAALSASPSQAPHDLHAGILAAGTWTRWMGLYDLHRTDRVVANWSIASAAEESFRVGLGGQGIAQTAWSPCGRYLVINERHASGLLVYDIRVTGQLLGVLAGRPAPTQQRLRCDVFPGAGAGGSGAGFEVWAGCHDGRAVVWEGVGARNDVQDASWAWAAHDAPVASVGVHPSGSVVATCSGGWGHLSEKQVGEGAAGRSLAGLSDARVFDESSLKVWALG